jgi:hypothetical protein|tara:strand:- start:574 stop:1089 length:516 start_codon:yes stop_codon:yes gene_type:complete
MAVSINGNGTVTGLTALPTSAMPSKSVIQEVSAIFAPYGDAGSERGSSSSYTDTGITLSITPSSGSKILVLVEGCSFGYQSSANTVSYFINLVSTPSGGSDTQLRETQIRFSSQGNDTARLFDSWSMLYPHTHGLNGSTAITYKCQHKLNSATYCWARYKGSQMTLLELKP